MALGCLVHSLIAAPLAWFPGPALDSPMSGSATLFVNGQNVLTGGDAYASYFYPVSYPIGLAATNGYWTYYAPYYGLSIAGGAVDNDGNIIIYGGTDGTNSQDATWAYNLSGDTPPTLPSMNVPRAYQGYATDRNHYAYAFGGLDAGGLPLASVERLNPTANSPAWTYLASLPSPRYDFPAVFNLTNYIYVFGGINDPSVGVETASVLRYSVSGNSWTNLAPLPVAVAGSAATLGPDGKIYVVGGTSGGAATNLVQVFDPAANSWTLSTPLPEGLSLAAAGVDSLGRLIVMGGVDANGYDVADVWRSQQFGVPDSAPVITGYPAAGVTYFASYTSAIQAAGSPPPTYSLVSGPPGMQVDDYSGAITWTPSSVDQIGTNPVTVQAANFAGTTNWTFNLIVANPPPTVPTNLAVVAVTESSVTLSWSPEDAAYGALTYSVWQRHFAHDPKGSGGTVWYTEFGSTTDTNFTISGLAAGTALSYYLEAGGPGGTSGYAVVSAATLPAPPPANLKMTGVTSSTITLAWDAPAGGLPLANYEILGWFDGIAAQYPLSYPGVPAAGTSITLTGIPPGSALLWGIAAVDTAGNVSSWDYLPGLVVNPSVRPAALTAGGPPPAASGGFQFTVQLDAAQTTYIQATTNLGDPASWETIATNPPTGSSFTFTDAAAGLFPTRYYRAISP